MYMEAIYAIMLQKTADCSKKLLLFLSNHTHASNHSTLGMVEIAGMGTGYGYQVEGTVYRIVYTG